MGKKSNQKEESNLFRDSLDDTSPLPQHRTEPYKKRLPPRPLDLEDEDDDGFSATDHYSDTEVEATDELLFSRPGVQDRVIRDLRRGRFEIGLELDLHGLTVAYARENLGIFLTECQQRHIRCARIIHGKGYGSEDRQPVLKQKINLWLRQREDVLAFSSATQRDGGTGAVYVLLRNPKKNRR